MQQIESKMKPRKPRKPRGKLFFTQALKYDKILRTIYEMFFKPVADEIEHSEEQDEPDAVALDLILGGGKRYFREYRLRAEIKRLPGEYYVTGAQPVPYSPRRRFPKGYKMLVQLDERTRDSVRVELFRRWKSDKSWVFRLTPTELKSIVGYIELPKSVTQSRPKKG